jgi:UDP-glucuronate decarboxylase
MTRPAFLLDSDVKEIVDHLPIGTLSELGGKHVLITGGRGFLGRYFTAVLNELNERLLMGNPVRVTVLDNFISAGEAGRDLPDFKHVRFVEHDVIKPLPPCAECLGDGGRHPGDLDIRPGDTRPYGPCATCEGGNWKRVNFILHAAGIASPAHYRAHPLETLEVATTGLKHSLELARANPGCRLVFFSSSEIYGDPTPGNVPTPETYKGHVACLGPRACYDESKRLGETLVQIYHQQFGVHGMIIRPFNVYGPGMQATDYRVLPNFAARIALGEPLEVYGDGKQTRTYCYVADAIGGFLRVLLHGRAGEPYNIGNPHPELAVNALVDVIRGLGINSGELPIRATIKPHPASYPADEPNRRCPDISKAARELGYAPRIGLEDGLRRFFDWALAVYPRSKAA